MTSIRDLQATDKICEQIDMNVFELAYPRTVVEAILAEQAPRRNRAGAIIQARVRACTPESMVLFEICCAWWRRRSHQQVWLELTDGLADLHPDQPLTGLSRTALSVQRARLGPTPFRKLITRCCHPRCSEQTQGAFYRGLRMVAIDGTLFNTPDTPANAQAFGRARNQYGQGAYPQARAVLLMEVGSRCILDVAFSGYQQAETHGVVELLPRIEEGMLLLGDCGVFSGYLLERCRAQGAHVLTALSSQVARKVITRLSDESYLTVLSPCRSSTYRACEKQVVRVIEYRLPDERWGKPDRVYRLVTTLLDEKAYPARELIEGYRARWDVELLIRELKSTLMEQVKVLRSRKPEGIEQELYALVLAHYGLRAWMMKGATQAGVEPRRMQTEASFAAVEQRVERMAMATPQAREGMENRLLRQLGTLILPKPRLRRNRREVKQVYNKYKPKKRGVAPPLPFGPDETYQQCVVLVVRPVPEKKPPIQKKTITKKKKKTVSSTKEEVSVA